MLMTPILCYGKYRISSLRHIKYYPYAANSLPYAVKGDFNGDGIPDMVLSGHDNDANIIVVLMSLGTTYYPITIDHTNIYETARKYDITLKIQPTELLILKKRGQQCNIGDDNGPDYVTLVSDGFAKKIIDWLNCNSKDDCGFAGNYNGLVLYQWQLSTMKFSNDGIDIMSGLFYGILKAF